ncbi:MAG: hypothetical protein LBQ18_01090 [Campylobacteraceae bacterium]|jgi:hypothetical protein|nr:hypothetical protein [Campylobacteraceae bacterium]
MFDCATNTLVANPSANLVKLASSAAKNRTSLAILRSIAAIFFASLLLVGCSSFKREIYTATFISHKDSQIIISAAAGSDIPIPTASRAGYLFTDWQEDDTAEAIAGGTSYKLTKNTTFKARYTAITYTVIFGSDTFKGTQDSPITAPAIAPKKGYIGVWQEEGGDVKVSNGTLYAPTKNATFQVQYEEPVRVAFFDADLNLLTSEDILNGETVMFCNTCCTQTWYEANKSSPISIPFAANGSINFYAIPNVIEVADQVGLDDMRNNLTGKYVLTKDIALSDRAAGVDSNGWFPIGHDYDNRFSGVFNGNGHKITKLWMDRTYGNYTGLFGFIQDATIKNLSVEIDNSNGGIRGHDRVGGIAGVAYDRSTIANSRTTGKISGRDYVGGIAGYVSAGSITNSYFKGNIDASGNYIGGIAGLANAKSIITGSYSKAGIDGLNNVGGIAGYIYSGSISNSYSTANISGASNVGGITGSAYYGSIITNNAALSSLVLGTANSNRIVGYIDGVNTVLNNIAKIDMATDFTDFVEGNGYSGTGKTDSVLKSKETYANNPVSGGLGWNFETIWKMEADKNGGHPYFYWQE